MAQGGPGLHPRPMSSLVGMEYIVNQCQCVGGTIPIYSCFTYNSNAPETSCLTIFTFLKLINNSNFPAKLTLYTIVT